MLLGAAELDSVVSGGASAAVVLGLAQAIKSLAKSRGNGEFKLVELMHTQGMDGLKALAEQMRDLSANQRDLSEIMTEAAMNIRAVAENLNEMRRAMREKGG